MIPRRLVRSSVPVILAAVLSAAGLRADTAAFGRLLETELRAEVERMHRAHAAERAAGAKPADFYFPYLLSGYATLYPRTREPVLLEWAKEDLLWLTRSAVDADGQSVPFTRSFRFLPSYADAYDLLRREGRLTPDEIAAVKRQFVAIAESRRTIADFGAQNRGLLYGVEFLLCAAQVPEAPQADAWRRHGEALVQDSLSGWSVEDASIYEPFWLNFVLLLADLRGDAAERVQGVGVRFYLEQARALLMPSGFMPDWGDGDWTHSWMWFLANFVRAGRDYRDGTYLEAARRLYAANRSHYREFGGEAIAGVALALRWLDPGVPLAPLRHERSAEAIDDVLSKKIVLRGAAGTYALFNYRDALGSGRFTRDYQAAQLHAFEEKPHHGHADENALGVFAQDGTMLLAEGGYRATFSRGWRADFFHNRIVARSGFPAESDVFDYLRQDTAYHAVRTEKLHFGTFGSLDYARTRLVDEERGYTGDRILIFAPESGLTIVVDSLHIDRAGPKVFCNTWHPQDVIERGDGWVRGRPKQIAIRQDSWTNPATRELLIQFLGNRDKAADVRSIDRNYHPSDVFFQYLKNYFFAGQRLTFVTVLRPVAPGPVAAGVLDDVTLLTGARDDGRTLGLRFSLDGERVTVGLKLDQTIGLTNLVGRPMFDVTTGTVAYGELATDADFAFVRERRDGRREFGFQYATALSHAGKTLFSLPPWREMYQGPEGYSVPDRRDKMPRWHEVLPR